MGAGDDTFVWNPGDDNDTVEGQDGTDTMLFNGANIAEKIDISANGERARFSRDIANVTMDLNDVETIDFNALGGADTHHGQRPARHRRAEVNIDLAGSVGGTAGDGAADTSSSTPPMATTSSSCRSTRTASLVIDGLAGRIVIEHFEAAKDRIRSTGSAATT